MHKKEFIKPKKTYVLASVENKKLTLKRVITIILGFGPGIFVIGYTIDTGGVTSMIVAGNKFGMQLLWVLVLSYLFSVTLMFAYGNYALITGNCALWV